MSSRLLRNAFSSRLWWGISARSRLQNYAMVSVPTSGFNFTLTPTLNNHFVANFSTKTLYSTQPVYKEHLINADSLLSNIISYYKIAGYVQPEQFQKFIEALENNDYDNDTELLTKENIQFILYVCGCQMPAESVEERMELFERLWQFLKQNNRLTKNTYMQKLQMLQHNRIPLENMESFLKDLAAFSPEAIETPEFFNELLRVACSCGNMRSAMDILSSMRERNFALTEENFNALIMGHGRNNDLNGIKTTVDSMQAAGLTLSKETQTTLIIAYMENGEKSKALDILKKYHGQLSVQSILRILRTGMLIDLDNDILHVLVQELPTEYTSGPDLSFELRQLCNEFLHNGKFHIVKGIISELPKPIFGQNQSIDTFASNVLTELFRVKIDEDEIISFAKSLIENEKNVRALHLVTEIAMHRNPPSALKFLEALSEVEPLRTHYFWPLMMYNFRRHGERGILTTLQHMKRMNVDCDNETLLIYVLPHMAITLDNPIQAVKMLIEAGVKSSFLITPVLRHLLGQQRIIESLQLIELYPIKLEVLEQLLPVLQQLSVNVRATRRYHHFAKLLKALVNRIENNKIDFTGQLLINMLNKQDRLQQDLRSFQRFLIEIERIGLRISPAAINSLESTLNSLSDTSDAKANSEIIKKIMQILNKIKDRNLSLPQNNSNDGENTNSSFIKHPRDMSLNDLECHLIELESKGMNARGVLRRLLQLYVRENNLERALEIKAKCDKLRVQESPGMLASIFDMYIKLGDLPKADDTLAKLQKTYPGFQLDEHKFIDYAALLVRENQLEKSLDLLAARSASQRINGGDYVIKNVWNFLTSIAQFAAKQETKLPAEKNLTSEAFEFLSRHGYCKAHNAVLGPIVREYLLRGDIKSAVAEFSKLAEAYKHTPLQFELLSILVRLSNQFPEEVAHYSINAEEAQKLLNEVTNTVAKVHGTVNMNSALVLAFAESGTDNQLRRLLMNPELSINNDLLQKNCEHLGKEGSVRTLLRLAKGARGLNRAINEQAIYNLLLSNFVKANDCNAALELFERLEADDDLKISTDFVKNLVNLLKANKLEVPSNVALRAYINKIKV